MLASWGLPVICPPPLMQLAERSDIPTHFPKRYSDKESVLIFQTHKKYPRLVYAGFSPENFRGGTKVLEEMYRSKHMFNFIS